MFESWLPMDSEIFQKGNCNARLTSTIDWHHRYCIGMPRVNSPVRMAGCGSAWGLDADRCAKLLIYNVPRGAMLGA